MADNARAFPVDVLASVIAKRWLHDDWNNLPTYSREECRLFAHAQLAALDAAGLEVRPKRTKEPTIAELQVELGRIHAQLTYRIAGDPMKGVTVDG